MNNPAMTIKGEQAKKQLIAAALAQFGGDRNQRGAGGLHLYGG